MGLRTPKQGSKRYRYLRSVRLHKPKPREFVKYQHCPATGKVCYATQDEAILVLGKTQWSKNREKRHERRVYQCPNCHQWHLTSVSQLSYRRYLHPREKAKVLLSRWKNLERFGGHRPKALDVYVERIDGYWTYSIAELDVRGKAETAAKAREYTRKVFPHDLLEVGLEFHYLHEKYSDIEHVYQRMCEQRYGAISQRAWREWMNKFGLEPEQVFVVPEAAVKAAPTEPSTPLPDPRSSFKFLTKKVDYSKLSLAQNEFIYLEPLLASVRSAFFRRGFRFRKYDPRYEFLPSIVFPKYCTMIVVKPCLWHEDEKCERRPQLFPRALERFHYAHRDEWMDMIDAHEELRAQGWDVIECFECELDGRVDEFVDQTAAHMVMMKMKHAGEKQLSGQFLERWQAYAKGQHSADLVPTLARQYKEIFTESFFADGPVHLPRRELAQWLYWCVTSQRPRGEYPLLSRWRS